MGRFVVHGVLVEEPRRSNTTNGIDCVNLIVEEKVKTPYNKEIVNIYSVDFMGKACNCIPENARLIGSPVVITGSIKSREYKGKYYNDLSGDALTIIDTGTFVSKGAMPTQVDVRDTAPSDGIQGANLDAIEIGDDDLPF